MIISTQIFIALIALILIAYIVVLVSRKRLMLKYSLLWLALSVAVSLCAAFPEPIFSLASFLGFETPSNFIFVIAIFFLFAISLSLSIIVSTQTYYINALMQELALLRHNESETSGSENTGDKEKQN